LFPKESLLNFQFILRIFFVVALNVIQKKNNKWRDKGKVLFLNLYKDILPVEQYLFVTITNIKTIEAEFYLENKAGIDAGLFKRIENHYEGLELCERFGESSDAVISSFLSDLRAFEEFP
jgi:hypothetical protein